MQLDYNEKSNCEANRKTIQNKKYSHLNIIFPIAANQEQLSQVISNRNELLNKKLNIIKNKKQTGYTNIIKYNNTLLKLPFYKNISNISTNNTFKYLYEKMFMGIYVKIVNNEVKIFAPFANMNFTNDWSNKITFNANQQSIRNFQSKKQSNNRNSKLYSKTGFINYDMTKWTTNNCLIGHEIDPITKKPGIGDNIRYTVFKYILDLACKDNKVSDVEFFINRRDNPMIRRNLTEPYFDIFDDMNHPMVSHKYTNYTPILSTCGSTLFADFMIPTEDDIKLASQKYFPNRCDNDYINSTNSPQWNTRTPTVIFRGGGTGCGVDIDSNQRLMLAHLSHEWESNDLYNENNKIDKTKYLDFGIVGWNSREKKPINNKMTYIKPKNFKFQLANRMNREQQLQYKYQIYVDGHVAAYRMCWLLATQSVILKVESKHDYQLWYFPLLKANTHYIPVKADLSDLAKQIEWCKRNDAKCKKIADNSLKFYNKYLKLSGLVDYTTMLLNMISANQSNNILKPIEPWVYVLFKSLTIDTVIKHKHKCAVIISYRKHKVQNREGQLKQIVPYLEKMLKSTWFKYQIYIIEQSDNKHKFNRGKLMNAGYDIATKAKCNYFILHDADLLADETAIKYYQTYPTQPIHIANVWTEKYTYENFIGGIISINKADYKTINGFPNNYWGWGGEDDEMMKRIQISKLQILKPITGSITEIKHGWNEENAIPKNEKNQLKRNHEATWKTNGLSNLKYKILSKTKLSAKTTKITVDIN
jgi:hypothetical protein